MFQIRLLERHISAHTAAASDTASPKADNSVTSKSPDISPALAYQPGKFYKIANNLKNKWIVAFLDVA